MLYKGDPIEDPTIVYWRIYYGDLTERSSLDGHWDSVPDDDVQIVVLWRADNARRMLSGRQFFWHDSTALLKTFGCTDNLFECHGHTKKGRYLPDDEWFLIFIKAMNDFQFYTPSHGEN